MKTFTSRSTLVFSVLVTLTTAGLLVAGGWLLQRQLIRGIEMMHDVEGAEISGLIGHRTELSGDEIAHRIKHDTDSDVALFFIQVRHQSGALAFRSENMGEAILPPPFDDRERRRAVVAGLGPVWISEFAVGAWQLQIASRLTPVYRVLRDYARVSAFLLVGAAIVSVGLGYGFSRFILRPVRAIEQTARRIRGDNLGERIPVPPGHDELAALAGLLNQMFDRLQAAFSQVQRFTADASHELKTPLALVRLNAEKLKSRLNEDPESSALLGDLLEEINHLHRIIESLLFLSKAEGGSLSLQLREFAIAAWIEDFAEDAQALAEDRGIRFVVTRNDDGSGWGEPNLLRQLLLNLVSNAIRVVPPGGTVTLASERTADRWRWTVTDDGPGLPPGQLERIFERFVRLSGSNVDEDGGSGHGLGLAICRSIAAMHGGTIHATNRTDRPGLRLIVEVPHRPSTADSSEALGTAADSSSPPPKRPTAPADAVR